MKKTNLRIDKTALSTAPLFDESDIKAYWLAQTPRARLRHIETLRRINYGHRATTRLQRVLEIAQRAPS
ncbi:MAG: hypothetical protein FJ009_02420 [Chloroflexi bacterium]|nr:hypothetical protein [Chloroflexota bacterium]